MRISHEPIKETEKIIYICPDVDEKDGLYYADYVTSHEIKEAVYSTREEAERKITVLNKIMDNS